MDNPFKSPLTTVSIGPGIRGIERGVERVVRLRPIAYVEIEAFIIANMVAGMEAGILDPAVIWTDCKTFPSELFRGKVDLLLAGYPCQPFSNAGKRKGTDDPRHLYPHIERAIRIIRPAGCFFENVRGHVTCGLPEVIESLEGLGYRVRWGIFSAEETGASHKRERVFILAIMANTESSGEWRGIGNIHKTDGRSNGKLSFITYSSGSELADSYNNGERAQSSQAESQSGEIESEEQRQERDEAQRQRVRAESCNGSESMGNANYEGLQGWISGVSEERSGEWLTRANGPFARKHVARPGQPQQAWEHPRVISREIESAMGLSIDGYNFREDFLRALGNSVYEDTAELAFRTLISKFL